MCMRVYISDSRSDDGVLGSPHSTDTAVKSGVPVTTVKREAKGEQLATCGHNTET